MTNLKHFFLFLLPLITAFALTSCNHTSDTGFTPGQTEYKPPVSQPLTFSKPQKINLDSIKEVTVHPVVKKFDLDKLPAAPYDTAGFKPFKYPVEEAKLDINKLPSKPLDIDKLPSRPLKFKTEKLPPPRLIHSGPPHLKDLNLSLFELAESQGLQGTVVTCMFTDRDGFLWIATNKGVYRYDGENLLLYVSGDATNGGLIISMLEDASGRIWMGTWGAGVKILDPQAGVLEITNRSLGLSCDSTVRILQDKRHRIWTSGIYPHGINIIDPETKTVKWLDNAHGLDGKFAAPTAQDKNNRIWIASDSGLNIVDPQSKKISYLNKSDGLKSDNVNNLLFDRSGRIWMASIGGVISVLDVQKNTIQTIKEAQRPGTQLLGLSADNRGRMWIGGAPGGGVTIIDPEKHLVRKLNTSSGLSSDQIINITKDNQGQVWIGALGGLNMIGSSEAVTGHIGKSVVNYLFDDQQDLLWDVTYPKGIDIIDRKSKTVRHLGKLQGLGNDTVYAPAEIGHKFYLPGNSGLDIIDPPAKTLTHIDNLHGIRGIPLMLVADKKGRLWIGSSGGLNVYDPHVHSVKYIGKALGQQLGTVDNISADSSGRIWLPSQSMGLLVIDPDNLTIQALTNRVPAFKDQSEFFLPDKKGDIWIGTDKGLYIADLKNKTFTSFSTPQGLIDERVATLVQYGDQVYASTVAGITVIRPPEEGIVANKKWGVRSFGNEYGLNKLNTGYGLTDEMDRDGMFLWGDKGVTVLDLSKKDTSRAPLYVSGINIMNGAANFTGRSHTVSNGQSWNGVRGPFNLPVNLELPHDQNYLQFSYSTLNFRPRDTIWYRYRLVGADKTWSEKTTAEQSHSYFSLSPGKYTFEVVARTLDQGWSKPVSFSFTINPPWWQTWWAWLLYLFLFAGIMWAFVALRSRQLVKEKRVLEQKVKARTEEVMQQKEEIEAQRDTLEKAFGELKSTQTQLIQSEKMASLGELTAGIAHEIQNPLNFVNNFSEVNQEMLMELDEELAKGDIAEARAIAADIRDNEQKINHHGKRADSIVKGMLEHSRNGSGQKEPTDINQLADEYLRLSYHGLRAKDKSFNAELITNFGKDMPKANLVQQDIGRVLLNLFNNAFYAVNEKTKTAAYGYKPEVSVSTSAKGGWITIEVKDNGTGIPKHVKDKIMQPFFTTKPTGEGTGLGLSLTYDMVVKGHGGSIDVDTVEGQYTTFMVKLPIN